MELTCRVFGHKWAGCMCGRCGERRDEAHNYIHQPDRCVEVCGICGASRHFGHQWFANDEPDQCRQTLETVSLIGDKRALPLNFDNFKSCELGLVAAEGIGRTVGPSLGVRLAEALETIDDHRTAEVIKAALGILDPAHARRVSMGFDKARLYFSNIEIDGTKYPGIEGLATKIFYDYTALASLTVNQYYDYPELEVGQIITMTFTMEKGGSMGRNMKAKVVIKDVSHGIPRRYHILLYSSIREPD